MLRTVSVGTAVVAVACAVLLLTTSAAATRGATSGAYETVECGIFAEDGGSPVEGLTAVRTCSADADGDGLTDPLEVAVGLDPRVSDAGKDADSDGLPNRYEAKAGLDPHEPTDRATVLDHDRDGIPDRVEMTYGLSPSADSTVGTDSDRDGLPDRAERAVGTDPNAADSDGDGFTDYAELTEREKLPNADPLHKDLYYEVDRMKGTELDAETKREATALFERVDVANPDGERGVAVHFVADDTIDRESPVEFSSAKYDFEREHRDHESRGYHYLVVVDELTLRNDSGYDGAANERLDVAMVESGADGQTVVHETGHLLGLTSAAHDGIDSERYAPEAYPSVMNYNYENVSERSGSSVFSDGSAGPNDHDDLTRIERDLAGTYAPEVNHNHIDDSGETDDRVSGEDAELASDDRSAHATAADRATRTTAADHVGTAVDHAGTDENYRIRR